MRKRDAVDDWKKCNLEPRFHKVRETYWGIFGEAVEDVYEDQAQAGLAQKMAERQERFDQDPEKYGRVWENQSFQNPLTIRVSTGRVHLAIDAGVAKKDQQGRANEDRVVVIPATSSAGPTTLLGVDGFGMYIPERKSSDGETAAEIIAAVVRENIPAGVRAEKIPFLASQEMFEAALDYGGVVYSLAQIEGNRLRVFYAGDVRVMVVRDGEIVFQTEDQSNREAVLNSVEGRWPGNLTQVNFSLEVKDRVVIVDDGILNQLLPEHYCQASLVEYPAQVQLGVVRNWLIWLWKSLTLRSYFLG
ncbi:hypothetical protein ACFLZP_04670 [Patescibacteria group bacterium]